MDTLDLKKEIKASPAQLRYADTLFYGALIGFVLMLVTYTLYILGVLEPQVPLDELPRLWTGSAADYRAAGLPCRAAQKGPGSVRQSMKWLPSAAAQQSVCRQSAVSLFDKNSDNSADWQILAN